MAEYLGSSDPAAPHYPTAAQLVTWANALISLNQETLRISLVMLIWRFHPHLLQPAPEFVTAEYDETPMNCAGQIDPVPPKEHQQQLHRGLRSGLEWSGRKYVGCGRWCELLRQIVNKDLKKFHGMYNDVYSYWFFTSYKYCDFLVDICVFWIFSVSCNEAWSKGPSLFPGTFHMRRRSKFSPKRADLTGITNAAFMMMDASYFGRLQILHMVGSV